MSTPLSPTVSRTVHIGPKSAAEMQAFERELDAIRDDTRRSVGESDARYIRRIQRLVRVTETLGRALLLFGWFLPRGCWAPSCWASARSSTTWSLATT